MTKKTKVSTSTDATYHTTLKQCYVCGAKPVNLVTWPILWQELIDAWELSPYEANYINRQQGQFCTNCNSRLRSIVLAKAIQTAWRNQSKLLHELDILEVNEAGDLHKVLKKLPGHVLGAYPKMDMQNLPFKDESFDMVVHSDTLEHIPSPMVALHECYRVLRVGGVLCYTVPIVIGRISRSRADFPASYHGASTTNDDSLLVHTEFGADAWTYPMAVGFSEVSIISCDFPAGLALIAYKR